MEIDIYYSKQIQFRNSHSASGHGSKILQTHQLPYLEALFEQILKGGTAMHASFHQNSAFAFREST